jgi:pyruvate/2-oxoglutarate dehydrogenase complex dihydrolipoamide dehydrogenase (E3) component
MAEELTPDICVVGGGPGGIAAALAAAADGVPVVLIEKGAMGGADLAYGSVPSSALVAAAEVHERLRRGPLVGVSAAPLQVNLGKVRDHVAFVCDTFARNVAAERLSALGVKVITAAARFTDRRTVLAGEATVRARRYVLAVGSIPSAPDLPGLKEIDYLTVESAFDFGRKPAHLVVLGAGRHGLTLAQAYSRIGIDATVVDQGPALAGDDPELAAIVVARLGAEGVRVRAGVRIESIARRRGGVRVTVSGAEEGETVVDGSHLLVAAGRKPNVDGLGLDAAGVEWTDAGIAVDRHLRTANRRIYAIGDAIDGPALAGRARHQARRVVRAMVFRLPPGDDRALVPAVVHTDPALASVGIGEAEARLRYAGVRILRFPFIENDRAQAERLPEGMVKVVTGRRGRVLGAAVVGRDAGDLVGPWSLAVARGLSMQAMRDFPVPGPTRSEIVGRVAGEFGSGDLTPPWRQRIIEFLRKLG